MPVACHLKNKTECYYPKPAFHADNGTAECAAAGRYTDKIWIIKAVNSKYHHLPVWMSAGPDTLAPFSAVCWYTGKSLFEKMGGTTPVGLMQTSVGGSPIEYWLPPSPAGAIDPNINSCEKDVPQCDNQYNDTFFFSDIVEQFVPHTIGALVWDQAERDVKCPVSTGAYACMQRLLATSWRKAFGSPRAAFVAVQLPGYTGALNNGTGSYPGYITGEMVFNMRLQQAAGTASPGIENASYVATYDLSCPTSPYGSVHNPQKGPIGVRVASQLVALFGGSGSALTQSALTQSVPAGSAPAPAAAAVVEGPHATSAKWVQSGLGAGVFNVTVAFAGGSTPFEMSGTKNCTHCCLGSHPTGKTSDGHTLDFDVSGLATGSGAADWVNSTGAVVNVDTGSVTFRVALAQGTEPHLVRYTAASIFPECALRNAEGLPALPFELGIGK
jgi:hypothetical protein